MSVCVVLCHTLMSVCVVLHLAGLGEVISQSVVARQALSDFETGVGDNVSKGRVSTLVVVTMMSLLYYRNVT